MSDDVQHRRMPKSRKVTILVMLVMAAANSITLIITIVRPTPQYAVQGVLLQVGARTEATLSKGMLDMEEEGVPGTPVETGWLPPGKFQPFQNSGNTFVDPLEMPSRVNTVPLHNTELISTSTPSLYLLPRAPCGDSPCGGSHLSATPTLPKPETTKSVHKSSTARPTATKSEQKKLNKVVKPDAIIELVVGLLGACLMRVEGSIACTSPNFSPNYNPIFQQAELDPAVIKALPSSPGAASIAILISIAAYLLSVAGFIYTLCPPLQLTTKTGERKSLDTRHQIALAFSSLLITFGLILALLATFLLRNRFIKSVKASPAINTNLQVKLGTGFTQLYVVCVFGGLVLIQCLLLLREDLRYPWWYMAGIGRFRKNPFETTEPGVIFAPSTLQKSRLDQRYYDWKNRTGVGRQIHPLPDFNKDPVATNINQPLKFLPPLPAMDGRVGSMTALPSQQTQALGSVAQGPPGYGGYSRPMTGHV